MMNTFHEFYKTMRWAPVLLVVAIGLGGCTVGPDYQKPDVTLTNQWADSMTDASEAMDLAEWWTVFNDPTMTSLIEDAFASNLDLQMATLRIRQARASRGMTASGLGPSVDASGSATRSHTSGGGTSKGTTSSSYQVGFDAGWELDLFGSVRREVESAEADIQAAIEEQRDVRVSLAAEVARNYVELRTYQQQLAIARKNLELQQHSASLTRKRQQAGLVGKLDVANADAQIATTEAQIPMLESSSRQSLYSLAILLNREPAALLEELSEEGDIPIAPPSVPVGVPSDLLRRRPDIRQAEASIHSATAQIGVATADLYPKVTINASIGWQAPNAGNLFSPLSMFWSLGPSVSWNLFDSGKTLSNIELQKALQAESILAYRQTVLEAIQEVENALIASTKEQEHYKSLVSAVEASSEAATLAQQLYAGGETDFLDVLSAQETLYSSEDSLVESRSTMAVELIALYKALGGGWRETPPEETEQP